MATKKTSTQAKGKSRTAAKSRAKGAPKKTAKAAPKKAPKGPPVATASRHPRARLLAAHGSKEALAKSLAPALARGDEDPDRIAAKLKTASNRQLLHLASVTETVKKKWGTREKMIAAIGAAKKKSKDQDYLAKLDTYSLSHLLDLAASAERAARA
ncbi:MAG TPA: hypothetical protein VK932_02065 [Kofleriaceae bacterium]|nr:hypothetical protein [Kofleriaceae bacterium]